MSRAAILAITLLIRAYQFGIRPLLIGTCKFVPSCSEYFLEAVHEWGVVRGSWLGVRRIARCHPFGRGGIDPVPKRDGSHC
ncbi:MAG: membrane protein insertion efficiency factor YidD [Phycisphaerae bacterium]|nr:membrane protein insertion efficiency factor YidD [Phycisphaerae bacterium]